MTDSVPFRVVLNQCSYQLSATS